MQFIGRLFMGVFSILTWPFRVILEETFRFSIRLLIRLVFFAAIIAAIVYFITAGIPQL